MQVSFFKIRADKKRVHFPIQSSPEYSVAEVIRMIKSITAKKTFEKYPKAKKQPQGGESWSDGFFVNNASKFGSEDTISKHVRNQGKEKEYKSYTLVNQFALESIVDTPLHLLRGD